MSETNEERARRGFAMLAAGDIDAVTDLFADDVKWHAGDPAAEGACQNRAQAIEFIRRARVRENIGELVGVRGAGDRVVVTLRAPGPPERIVANVTTFRDGKVVEMVHYPDPADALAAVGLPTED
jgi:ketosteroid isomerase-like protein